MQVQFKSTNRNADTHCCICGQGFELLWEQQPRSDRPSALFEIQKTLCNHHHGQTGRQAHPQSGLLSSEWDGFHAAFSATNFGLAQTHAV